MGIVNNLFYSKIFNLIFEANENQRNKQKAFEILANLIHNQESREKLAK